MKYNPGDLVICPAVGKAAVVVTTRPSIWQGLDILVDVDEPFPYIGQPNPHRKIWAHESHFTQVVATA